MPKQKFNNSSEEAITTLPRSYTLYERFSILRNAEDGRSGPHLILVGINNLVSFTINVLKPAKIGCIALDCRCAVSIVGYPVASVSRFNSRGDTYGNRRILVSIVLWVMRFIMVQVILSSNSFFCECRCFYI